MNFLSFFEFLGFLNIQITQESESKLRSKTYLFAALKYHSSTLKPPMDIGNQFIDVEQDLDSEEETQATEAFLEELVTQQVCEDLEQTERQAKILTERIKAWKRYKERGTLEQFITASSDLAWETFSLLSCLHRQNLLSKDRSIKTCYRAYVGPLLPGFLVQRS